MRRFSTENIKAGDKVICKTSGNHEHIGIVVKNTPSGLVDVEEYNGIIVRYSKDGSKRGESEWSHSWITQCTPDDEERIKNESRRRFLARKLISCNIADFSLESLEKMWAICQMEMEEKTDGNGIV